MRGTAECNARKTEDREYPERQDICAQDVMLMRHEIHVCRKGCTFRTAPTIMFETCLCVWACGVCSVTVYFKFHVAVKPDGCAYTSGGAFW